MMRGKLPSPSKTQYVGFESDYVEKLEEPTPRLPGAYIRTLVRQLASKGCFRSSGGGANSSAGDGFPDRRSENPRQGQRRQVRRRLHTTRPYQEKFLNMAEVRREIVTALKFHRAAMKRAREREMQSQVGLEIQSFQCPSSGSCHAGSGFSYPPGFCCPDSLPVNPIAPLQEDCNFALPAQALGLNLNLQDFANLDTASFHCSTNPSFSVGFLGREEPVVCTNSELHPTMDDLEMAEIRSIGEQYQIELNDTLNSANSAWWFEFLKSMEIEPESQNNHNFVNSPIHETVEGFPAWLNTNDNNWQYHDPASPRMEIEGMDTMDMNWLA